MSLPDDYFRDTDEPMLTYLEGQAKEAIANIYKSNHNNRLRAERILNYLLLGIGSLSLLVLNNPNILNEQQMKMGVFTLLAIWMLAGSLIIARIIMSSTYTITGNAPEKLYNESFKQANDPMKLMALRQMELRNYSDTIKELQLINKRFQKWTDIALVLAVCSPGIALLISLLCLV